MLRPGRTLAPLLVFSALSVSASGASASEPPWGAPWSTDLRADHPLVGAVVDTVTGEALAAEAVAARLAAADVVLLGEKHDNPDHHRAQAWLLGLMVDAGRHPALVMEMLDTGQGDALADYLARDDATAAGLGDAVGWGESGWPDWTMYQPIAEVALTAGLPILTGNLPPDQVRRVSMDGPEAVLGADGLAPRALDAALPPALTEALGQEILRGHCDMLPESAVPSMIAAQRARDGEMARALLAGRTMAGTDGAVLIAGNGHVRADRAVPWSLGRLDPAAVTLTVGVMEIPDDLSAQPTPEDLMPEDLAPEELMPADGPAFDLLVFTPALEDIDPCEKFRAQLERMRARHGGGDGSAPDDTGPTQ